MTVESEVKVRVAQLCLTLCNPTDYTVHGILQARILEWIALSLLQGIFPTQGLNPGLHHCRRILYQLSHKGSPCFDEVQFKYLFVWLLLVSYLIQDHEDLPLFWIVLKLLRKLNRVRLISR